MLKNAILSTCFKLPFGIKIFVLSIVEWPLKTVKTVIVVANYGRFVPTIFFDHC